MPTILERVTKVTIARLSVKEEAVVPSASFTDDLGADSLDLVELIMGLEEEFGTAEKPIKIPDEDAAKIKTVQDAVDYLKAAGVSDSDVKTQAAQAATPAQKATQAAKTAPKASAAAAPRKKSSTSPSKTGTPKSPKTTKNSKPS